MGAIVETRRPTAFEAAARKNLIQQPRTMDAFQEVGSFTKEGSVPCSDGRSLIFNPNGHLLEWLGWSLIFTRGSAGSTLLSFCRGSAATMAEMLSVFVELIGGVVALALLLLSSSATLTADSRLMCGGPSHAAPFNRDCHSRGNEQGDYYHGNEFFDLHDTSPYDSNINHQQNYVNKVSMASCQKMELLSCVLGFAAGANIWASEGGLEMREVCLSPVCGKQILMEISSFDADMRLR